MITVLMPVYNGERYLREAIESILNQTFADFEFLIINDGSTDNSRAIIDSYTDPRIRLVDNPANTGLTRSLNRGMRLALGKYVARQDADDISEPHRLARQLRFMEDNPQLALLGCWYREIDANGQYKDTVRPPGDQTELQWALLFYCPFVHSGVMLRRSFYLDEIGLYDEGFSYAQDHELWLRTSRQHRLTTYAGYLVRYRFNPHSMSATYGELTNEGTWLTAAIVGSLLGWAGESKAAIEVRFRILFKLLYGSDVELSPAEIAQLTGTIWQLHDAFSRTYQLDQRQRVQLQVKLRKWLSWRYVHTAYQYHNRRLSKEARQLYLRGLRLYPLTFCTTRSALLLWRLLLIQPTRVLWYRLRSG